MGLVKYNIINFLLQLNIKFGRKLTYLLAKYEADEYAEKNENIDLRSIPSRIKQVILHDQDCIDKRFSMCQGCEHFISTTSQCKKCLCFMKVKTKLVTSRCPIGKWEKEIIKGKKIGSLITS